MAFRFVAFSCLEMKDEDEDDDESIDVNYETEALDDP